MKNKAQLLIKCGIALIIMAFILTGYNFYEQARAAKSAAQAAGEISAQLKLEKEPSESKIPAYISYPDLEMPKKMIDNQEYIGILAIPDLNLELPIISEWSEDKLKIAPCRYSGSAYKHDMVICGHNYTAHFGKLKNLQLGSVLTFTDMEGNIFLYSLEDMETVEPDDFAKILENDWDLTLFTCTVGAEKRIVLYCAQIN